MENHKLDFHSTFRMLSGFKPSLLTKDDSVLEGFVAGLLMLTPEPDKVKHAEATSDWLAWLESYAVRIESERDDWGEDMDKEREEFGRLANPRFVLRQWVLEEVIAKVEKDPDSGKRVLAKVMHVSGHFWPFFAEI